jgi:hypothetical protein
MPSRADAGQRHPGSGIAMDVADRAGRRSPDDIRPTLISIYAGACHEHVRCCERLRTVKVGLQKVME